MRTSRTARTTWVVIVAVVLALALGASASADPGQSAHGDLVYACPYTGIPVTAVFDVTQLDGRNKGAGTATISTEYGSFSMKVKLARVDVTAGTAYFAGPTSESKYSNWWYFAVRADEAGDPAGTAPAGAYGRYVFGSDNGLKAEWVALGYIGGFLDFVPLTSGWVAVSG